MTLRKKDNTGNRKRKNLMAFSADLTAEEVMELSYDRLPNANRTNRHKPTGTSQKYSDS